MVKFKIADILNTSEGVKNHVEQHNEIPPTVNVAGVNYLTSQFADVMTRAILQLDPRQKQINYNDIENRPVNFPSTSVENITLSELDLNNYVDLADKVYGATNEKMIFPQAGKRDTTYISYMGLVYAFARILTWYKNNGEMPTRVYLKKWTGKPAIGGGSNPIPDNLKQYLVATANCQVNDPVIQSVASGLSGAQSIFNYVLDLTYDFYYNTERGAVQTIKGGIGNCTDLSHVMVALARAKGIPARYVNCSAVKFSSMTTGHVWAELYVNGAWVRADASNNSNTLGNNPRDSQIVGSITRYIELPF